jgi:rRNA maturation endonuclease Nob1
METLNCEFCDKIMKPAEHDICDICGDCLEENESE